MPSRLRLRRTSLTLSVGLLVALLCSPLAAQEERSDWPKEIVKPAATITIYQPQVERFEGNDLEARAAVSVSQDGGPPQFGAIWVTAKVDSDRGERVATLRNVSVPQVKFNEASEEAQAKLRAVIEESVPAAGLEISLDLLVADMDPEGRDAGESQLKHEPPRILYRNTPTILITLDGDPIFQDVEGARGVEKVVNTPFTLLREGGSLWLSAGRGLWYEADAIEGPWSSGKTPPGKVAALEPEDADASAAVADDQPAPDVIVVTEPTELIVSAGAPTWTPVQGGDLLYLDNSDSDVFLEVASQRYYVLLSGRWYRGHAMGQRWSWEHVPNDELPKAFAGIPIDSANGHVLPMVAGTPQATDAVLDNTIPQTAAVKRQGGGASIQVTYDGRPKFESIEGIPAKYAVNTAAAVFELGDHYWLCEQAVWYDAPGPNGPWAVSAEVPDVLYRIPPSNPHYNVTYVRVYDTTPDVVYVGYTPGYAGSYVYAGSVVYGTGWVYAPWYGSIYYPRPPTWGFRVGYNPWTGWSFGLTWSNGPFSFGIGFGGGWFGPVGYRPWGRPYVGGGFRKTDINIDRSVNVGDIDIDRSRRTDVRNNLYQRGDNVDRVVQRPDRRPGVDRPGNRPGIDRPGVDRPAGRPEIARPEARPNRPAQALPAQRPNDVFTDRAGNVYRRDGDGAWSQRDAGDWRRAEGLDRPTTRDLPSTRGRDFSRPERTPSFDNRATRPQLERDYRARSRGLERQSGFQRSRGSFGGRGGGGRRR